MNAWHHSNIILPQTKPVFTLTVIFCMHGKVAGTTQLKIFAKNWVREWTDNLHSGINLPKDHCDSEKYCSRSKYYIDTIDKDIV